MSFLATAMACLAIGCPGSQASMPEPSQPPRPFVLRFEKSGGLKPVPMSLTIRAGRRAQATMGGGIGGGTRTVRFRVSRSKVATLRSGLRRAHFLGLESPLPGNCADCFLYFLAYRGHELTIDQSAMPRKLGEVVAKLESIVFEHAVRPSPGEVPHRPFH